MPHPSVIPPAVASRRLELFLSQRDFCFLLGQKSPSHLSKIERGLIRPSFETILTMEIVFGLNLTWLYGPETLKIRRRIATRAELLARRYARVTRNRFEYEGRAATLLKLATFPEKGGK